MKIYINSYIHLDNKICYIKYIVGQNAKDNHNIIKNADKYDWWFHMKDHPSCHCIIETTNITPNDMIFASNLIKLNTKYTKKSNTYFCYTQIKNVKPTKNPGEVKLLGNPSIYIN
jgi:predicted ribosome quality control (RQC) complex YloA/Tae2 family protein